MLSTKCRPASSRALQYVPNAEEVFGIAAFREVGTSGRSELRYFELTPKWTALLGERIGGPDALPRLVYTAGRPPGTEPTALAIARSSAVVTHAVDHSVM